MPLIVQKFGGSSVADAEKILAAARKAIRTQQQGNQVVMVVSAMGDTTDDLIELAGKICERPPAREMDMLLSTGEQVSVALMAMAIHALGYKAVSLTGAQIGIKTDATHTKARIKSISTDRVQRLLNEGHIVIAAGFQGIDDNFDITTLGRGGSDTTAVALAAVLGADACEIYTDVDGVYTTDPRLLPEARHVERISYDEMLELASLGAGVMHNRSIEFAKKFGTAIHVRSSFSDTPGSLIVAQPEFADRPVCGAAVIKNEARVSVLGVPDQPGVSLQIFSPVAARNVNIDMIAQNVGENGLADVSFTVPRNELSVTLESVLQAVEALGAGQVAHDENVAKVSVVGLGMAKQSGVAEKMFAALAAENVNIQMITTSEIKISVLVERDAAATALRAVHNAFELDNPSPAGVTPLATAHAKANPADVASRLHGANMEELFIDDISLDETQGRVTISGVPDQPGIAARVFREVAAGGVFVDMIVQSHGSHAERASLSFTVPRGQVEKATEVARRLVKQLSCKGVSSCPNIAKLSVSGVGLRSHTGVAIRMFRALAEAGVNVDMISTSEVRVNVVVDGRDGDAALSSLRAAFADALG
ncbi:MAG TPA: aspartate kinase [Candidatus Anammoximicrobium sp.]|nr:aspartate kinase [Candidatus Anammoximicrobium sp.]